MAPRKKIDPNKLLQDEMIIHTIGVSLKIKAPKTAEGTIMGRKQLLTELLNEITEKSTTPEWTGFFDFPLTCGNTATINRRQSIGI